MYHLFSLRQLNSFLTVAESGGFTRAAGMLNIAQPALGWQVRMPEESPGVEYSSVTGAVW
ncbi:MAG: hypothetical protein DRR04_01450 [Gammaproteobacteria bacterium]|nr:MAG: hypothetical protein DRQ97_02915 [Gammaproteobacteria bacterium]RLA62036.1 MAG: hypothetical protein DRR04_01450 [Gammaproteobacteria bacterium]